MKTENLSIVFVDIAGFTPRTSRQTREENEHMLRRFADVVKPLVRVYRGTIIKTLGDAYLLTFGSPTDALLCSTAIHDSLVESNGQVDEDDRFEIRCAVNVGEVRVEAGDIFGEAVNIAARIEGKAGLGEIYFSEAVYLSMTRSEVPAEEVGYFELKGIPEKVRLYRIPQAGDAGGYTLESPQQAQHLPSPSSADDHGPETHALAPDNLPFAGLGLSPVRDKLRRRTGGMLAMTPTAPSARAVATTMARKMAPAREMVQLYFNRWYLNVRRSRRWQGASAMVLIAVIGLLAWGTLREKPKPMTAWEKVQHKLGF